MNINEKFINSVSKIVYSILQKEKLLIGQWHLGKVESVISTKKLSVYVDGSTIPQEVSCNPDITFSVNDEVWIIFINNDSRNKFAISKRAI